MAVRAHDFWSLVLDQHTVDSQDLADAVAAQVNEPPLDFRTRLLIRDSVEALRDHWGEKRFREWLENCPVRALIEQIWIEDLGKPGFPFLPLQLSEHLTNESPRREENPDKAQGEALPS
jgi:hypothetical protein